MNGQLSAIRSKTVAATRSGHRCNATGCGSRPKVRSMWFLPVCSKFNETALGSGGGGRRGDESFLSAKEVFKTGWFDSSVTSRAREALKSSGPGLRSTKISVIEFRSIVLRFNIQARDIAAKQILLI